MQDRLLRRRAGIKMKVALSLLHLVIVALISFRVWRSAEGLRNIFVPALLLKLCAGVAIGLLYTYYYSVGDTWLYFHDGELLEKLARQNPAGYLKFLALSEGEVSPMASYGLHEPRALFMVKIVSLFNLMTLNNYWVVSIYFSLLSFLGAWFLLKELGERLPGIRVAAIVALLFLPSAVFWSSGLIKESLAMAGIYFLSGIFIRLWFSGKVRLHETILALLSIWVAWNLKYYYAAIFLAVVVTSLGHRFLIRRLAPRLFFHELLIWLLIFLVPLFIVTFLHPNFSPERLMSVIVENNRAYSEISSPEDLIGFHHLKTSAGSLILNSPWAAVSGLFRPFVWESGNMLQLAAALENLLLLLVSIVAVFSPGHLPRSGLRMLIVAVVAYVLILAVFITLSTPNFGTLSRYRVAYLPFFAMLVFSGRWVLPRLQRSLNRLVQ